MRSRRASLEIGINTIVILIIAIVLLGLGIGFVINIFGEAGKIIIIEPDPMMNIPNSDTPIKMTPSSLEIKRGDEKTIDIGVYNKEAGEKEFEIVVGPCRSAEGDTAVQSLSLTTTIPSGDDKAFRAFLIAKDADGEKLMPGSYICSVGAADAESGTLLYDAQFTMVVTS